jgi:class 3 adenylate cyclase
MAELLTQTEERPQEASPVDGLIAYLRAHPYRLDHPRQELAEKFGLDEDFVGDVLDTLRGSPNKLARTESVLKAFSVTLRSWGASLSRLYDEFTERPVVALFVTLVLTVSVVLLLRHMRIIGVFPAETLQTASLLLGGTLVLLHAFVYFRHGMMRYAIYGSGIALAVAVATLVYVGAGRPIQLGPGQIVPASGALPFLVGAGFGVAIFYFMFATVVCLVGGYWKTKQADLQQQRLSRQELIDRLFYLQEQLRARGMDHRARRRPTLAVVLRTTAWLPVVALSVGFAVGLVSVLVRGLFAKSSLPTELAAASVPTLVTVFVQVLTAVTFLGLGYFSGGVRRSVVALVSAFAGILAAELTPFGYFGPDYIAFLAESGRLLEGVVNTLVLAVLVGIGAHIDKRARVRQKLQEHEPAHVTAEIVEIQWRLNPSASASCVMVVDVAGSTRMKAEADPLAVEYSFRAYHDFVAEIARRRGGTVLSTAGDGVVLTFGSCGEALYAAKEIQTKIAKFNGSTNRLPSSFHLRIGIHTGQVVAQLQEVPFNELIDIAAHVEKESPVGGIAVTQRVVENLEDERVAALKDPVDGQNVYVVMNPTLAS